MNEGKTTRPRTLFHVCLFAVWGAVVIATLAHHEVWRDEVRPLSAAMDSSSPSDLARIMTDDGHPLLWPFLLYAGYHLTSSVVVLPVFSVLIAAAAVYLFIVRSPLSLWVKALFVLSGLPLYEYSVMARNYGISMLLLFTFASIYPARKRHAVAMGVTLALLCNTNAHSMIFAVLLASLWLWDTFVTDRRAPAGSEARSVYVAMAVIAAGAAVSLYSAWPTTDSLASDATGYTAWNVLRALRLAVETPSRHFRELFPVFVPMTAVSAVLLGSLLGLVAQPFALATGYAGLCGLSVFFGVFYPAYYRHEGLFIAFLVCLYWIVLDGSAPERLHPWVRAVFRVGVYGGFPLLLSLLVVSGAERISADWRTEESASKAFHGFLQGHPEYANAILVGEPDYYLESLRYYEDHPLYLARERRFASIVRFVRSVKSDLSLGELLCAAWGIQERRHTPVLIALGHLDADALGWESRTTARSLTYSYGRTFSWSVDDLAAWKRHTTLLRQFSEHISGDERYAVYRLNTPAQGAAPPCPSTP